MATRIWRRRSQRTHPTQSHHQPDELPSDDSRSQSPLPLNEEEEAIERVVEATKIPGDWETALELFRPAWKMWTRARGDAIRAPEMLKSLDATEFIALERMVEHKLHERADTHVRHMDRSKFWKMNSLDLWGLFGITGCVKSFLEPLLRTGSLASLCTTAEEAIGYLRQARDMRRRGEVSCSNRALNAEWAPQDITRAIELVKQAKPSLSNQPPPTPSTSPEAPAKPTTRPTTRSSTAIKPKPSSSKQPPATAKMQSISSKQPYTASKTQQPALKHSSAASKALPSSMKQKSTAFKTQPSSAKQTSTASQTKQPFTKKAFNASKIPPAKQPPQKKKTGDEENEPINISSTISESSDLTDSELEDADKNEDEQNGDEEDEDSTIHVTARRNGARIPTPEKGRGEAAAAGQAQRGEASPPSFLNFGTRQQQHHHHNHNPNFRPLADTTNTPTRSAQHTQHTNTYAPQHQYPQYPPSSPPRPPFSPLPRDEHDDDDAGLGANFGGDDVETTNNSQEEDDEEQRITSGTDDDLRTNPEDEDDQRIGPTAQDKSYLFSDAHNPLNDDGDDSTFHFGQESTLRPSTTAHMPKPKRTAASATSATSAANRQLFPQVTKQTARQKSGSGNPESKSANHAAEHEDDEPDEDPRDTQPPPTASTAITAATAGTASPSLRKMSYKRRCSTSFFTPKVAKKRRSAGTEPEQEAFDATTYEVTTNALDDYFAFVARDITYIPRGSLQEVESEIKEARENWEIHLREGGDPRQSNKCNVFAMLADCKLRPAEEDHEDDKEAQEGRDFQEDDRCTLVWVDWAAKRVTFASPQGCCKGGKTFLEATGLRDCRVIACRDDREDTTSGHSAASMDNAWLASIIARLLTSNSTPSSTPSSALHVWSYTIYCMAEQTPITSEQHVGFQSKQELAREVEKEVLQFFKNNTTSRQGSFTPFLDSVVNMYSELQDRFVTSHDDACSLREEAVAIRKLVEHLPPTPQEEPPEAEELREIIRALRVTAKPNKTMQKLLQEHEKQLADLLKPLQDAALPRLDDLNAAMKDAITSASVAAADYEQAQRELRQDVANAISCLQALQPPDGQQ